MKLGLILSNDWELFGDGSGDYFEVQHKPLEALLTTVESHGAKLTVMAEVAQQWAHQELSPQESWAGEVADAWEAILQDTISRASDVQLHVHPQWLKAIYKNNCWRLDLNQLNISGLPDTVLEDVLAKGKNYLENLLQPVVSDYRCLAFRAGAYCQPSKMVMEKLLKAGLLCDTSIIKNLQHPGFYDYRDAHSNIWPWYADAHNIKSQSEVGTGLIEIPIHSCQTIDSPFLRKLISHRTFNALRGFHETDQDREWALERRRTYQKKYPTANRVFPARKALAGNGFSTRHFLSKFATKKLLRLNYDVLPPAVFVRVLKNIFDAKSVKTSAEDIIIPVMAIGHVKMIHNCENIDRVLARINKELKDRIVYWTLSDALKYWSKRGRLN